MTPVDGSPVDGSPIDRAWSAVVTAALLGADRRPPPELPPGGIADLVADAVEPDDAARFLAAVAAFAAVRRAGFVAGAPADRLQPPRPDPRPWCPAAAVAAWRRVAEDWPVLTDEWLQRVTERGFRVPADVLVELLTRADPVRRARVAVAAGPVAPWLVGHLPELAGPSGRSVPAEALAELPDLPIPPDLAELLDGDALTVATRLATGVGDGTYSTSHRSVLVNLLARCRPEALPEVAARLAQIPTGLASSLAALATARHQMLEALP